MRIINKKSMILLIIISIFLLNTSKIYATGSKEIIQLALDKQNLHENSYLIEMDCTVIEKVKDKDKINDGEETETNSSALRVYIYNGGERQMVTFTAPEDLVHNKFLIIGTNNWMSKKNLRRPIRISGQQRIFGDAGIGETVGINYYRDYDIKEFHEVEDSYIIDLLAKDEKTTYQQVKLTISKDTNRIKHVILKAVSGTPLKELNYKNHRKIGNHEVADIVIKNLLQDQDRVTELKYIGIQVKELSPRAFQPLMMSRFDLLIKD
ncbi:outer membrane lipoprotein-sorting protein [Iocasia frigidifontis]|uniref:Outer membrane lipoprotein-sorting protein n=1 Tax=Iocasia fonsfrigidae TaxID=2682810 RepID=A0A8A7KH46_9FIRM|nr:outer membrane lipoprotein-sorting protein [Iocasia fonsfrigidae]QTL99405.1 outer membrane lipoprotein-sorting protein [Iocasia fonsfrigidae]